LEILDAGREKVGVENDLTKKLPAVSDSKYFNNRDDTTM